MRTHFLRDFISMSVTTSLGQLHVSASNNTGFDPLTDAQWGTPSVGYHIGRLVHVRGKFPRFRQRHAGSRHGGARRIGAVVFTQMLASGDARPMWRPSLWLVTNIDVVGGIASTTCC